LCSEEAFSIASQS